VVSLHSPKGRKIIATGVALLALLAITYIFDSLNRSTHMVNEAVALKQGKLAKYREKLLEENILQRELSTLQNTVRQGEASLLTGKTPSLAAAEIQRIVSSIANSAGGQIKAVRIVQPDRSGKEMYLAIPVEVTINCTIRELTQFLYKLDSSTKLLRVAKLSIRPAGGRGRRRSSVNLVIPVNLVTTLTVEGFVTRTEI
jgi:Tfp pilus assembly protein PilO